MKFKILIVLITQMVISGAVLAQNKLKKLKVGDNLPLDMELGKMANYKSKNATLSDFKTKLVILDFWATWCGPCVASLPKMDSLQKKFKGKISIIGVNGIARGDNAQKSEEYLKYKGLSIPSVVEDENLHEIFEAQSLPTEVWIDENGRVLAITKEEEVNSKNIDRYLNSGKLSISHEKDDLEEKKERLMASISKNNVENLYQVIISGQDGNTGDVEMDYYNYSPPMLKTYSTINSSIFHLYDEVLSMFRRENTNLNPTRFFIETKDSTFRPLAFWTDQLKYRGTDKVNSIGIPKYIWNENAGLFSYSVKFPKPGILDSVFYRKYLLEDLNKCFEFKGRVERRKIPSWVIIKMSKTSSNLSL